MKQTFITRLNSFFLLCMLLPGIGIAQTKNVISTQRLFPKIDKVQEFEKALAAHAQKYHTGDVAWHVFSIQSGPDARGYQVTEGPTNWENEDSRGDISDEHKLDWNKNVAIYLTDRYSGSFSVYIDSLSTTALEDFTEKINIAHIYPKIARGDEVVKLIRKLKKAWLASGVTVAVYAASSSGRAQYTLVTRYKQGLKERTTGFRKPFKEVYESVNGEGSYAQYLKDVAENVDENWSELLYMRKDLSSR